MLEDEVFLEEVSGQEILETLRRQEETEQRGGFHHIMRRGAASLGISNPLRTRASIITAQEGSLAYTAHSPQLYRAMRKKYRIPD
jgi:hypothetical protein